MSNAQAVDAASIQEITKLAREAERGSRTRAEEVVEKEIHGEKYVLKPDGLLLHFPKPSHEPGALTLTSLQSLVDFINNENDSKALADRKRFVHIAGPGEVVYGGDAGGPYLKRVFLATAHPVLPTSFKFGVFQRPADFNLALLVCFDPTPDRAEVFRVTGNLKNQAVQTYTDDGVSQSVTASAGVSGAVRQGVEVPGMVQLRPYRTFAEVEQPISPFVLRMQGGDENNPPGCALFEADGGKWRLDAIRDIKAFLTSGLPKEVKVYG
jgi:hypothetical protein